TFIRGLIGTFGLAIISIYWNWVREPDNLHDNYAVALHLHGIRSVTSPGKEGNEMLSRLLDAGVIDLLAEIAYLKTKAAAWENVHIAVYVLKALDRASLSEPTGYLTVLETPHYRTHHLAELSPKIARFGEIPDKNGCRFFEVFFKT